MRNEFISIIGLLAIALLLGCGAGGASNENRHQSAIRYHEERLASIRNPIQAKWYKDILSRLRATKPGTISKPQVASATLLKRKDGTYGLFVFWLEDHPTVDAVELEIKGDGTPLTLPIPEQELKQNESAAKDTIVFGCEYHWDEMSPIQKKLESMTNAPGLRVRLLQTNRPLTEWVLPDVVKPQG